MCRTTSNGDNSSMQPHCQDLGLDHDWGRMDVNELGTWLQCSTCHTTRLVQADAYLGSVDEVPVTMDCCAICRTELLVLNRAEQVETGRPLLCVRCDVPLRLVRD